MAYRALSPEFFAEFKTGKYKDLIKCIQKSSHFMLNLRHTKATIYYKCLHVLTISKSGTLTITPQYVTIDQIKDIFGDSITKSTKKTFKLNISDNMTGEWNAFLSIVMHGIDDWRNTKNQKKAEKEIQQRLVMENNTFAGAKSTDYFIIDTEYAESEERARFDAIAVYWSRAMRHNGKKSNYTGGLAFIEVKVGEKAITGDSESGKCGIPKHWEDIVKYKKKIDNDKGFYEDIGRMVDQLYQLGFIKMDKSDKKELKIDNQIPTQMIFVLANYNQRSNELKKALKDLAAIPGEGIELRFATSSFMGYGLYEEGMLDLDTFIKRFNL